MGAGLGQLVNMDAKGGEGIGGDFPADPHAIIPPGEEEIGICRHQDLAARIAGRQLGQFLNAYTHLFIQSFPAGNACVANHMVRQAQDQHHLGQIDVIRDGPLGRRVKGDGPITALHAGLGQRRAQGQGGEGGE